MSGGTASSNSRGSTPNPAPTPTATATAKRNPVMNYVDKVSSWNDFAFSLTHAFAINVGFLLMAYLRFHLLSTVLFMACIAVGIMCPVTWFFNLEASKVSPISKESVVTLAEAVHSGIDNAWVRGQHVIYWEDTRLSVAVCVLLFVSSGLIRVFSVPIVTMIILDGYIFKRPVGEYYELYGAKIIKPHVDNGIKWAQKAMNDGPAIGDLFKKYAHVAGKKKA